MTRPPEPKSHIAVWAAIAASLVIFAVLDFVFFPPPTLKIRTASTSEILAAHPAQKLFFRFAPDPNIVIIDFPSSREQAATLDRATAFLMRQGIPHDRVLTNVELAAILRTSPAFDNAHAYSAADLVRFFRLMARDHVMPNREERQLQLLFRELHWSAPGAVGAIVALAPDQPLSHALANAAYFVSPAYAVYAQHFFHDTLTLPEQTRFTRFLAARGYDTDLTDLVVNETQSLLCFTPAFDPTAIGLTPSQIQSLRTRFLQKIPLAWLIRSGGFAP
jgi:hypothetical protein